MSCVLLLPFRTCYVSSNECDEQRSLYACIRVVTLVLRTGKLSPKLASPLRDV